MNGSSGTRGEKERGKGDRCMLGRREEGVGFVGSKEMTKSVSW